MTTQNLSQSPTLEQNKQIAREFFARFSENDIAGALDMMTDDVTYWIAGKPGLAPSAGVKTKADMEDIFSRMNVRLKTGLRMTVKGVIAEDDKVALQVESYGELKNGRVYNNEYHTLITIRDGKIGAVAEYLDTHHVVATWFTP
jgi:ketosteroid isomerase-like protein